MNNGTNISNHSRNGHRKVSGFALLTVFFVIALFLINVSASQSGPILWIEIGRASKGCAGFGICRGGVNASEKAVLAETQVSDNTLFLHFTKPLQQKGDLLFIDEDIRLDSTTAFALGYKEVTLTKGAYQMNYTANPNGDVQLAMQAHGPIIWVEIGRRSAGCTRFGLCRGGVERIESERAVPAVARMMNGSVQLDFVSKMPDAEAMMPVEEDIVLDSATSHIFGEKHLVVTHGVYPVDYTKNPYGTVQLSAARGPIVWLEIGRPSRNCKGLGICAGGVEMTSGAVSALVHGGNGTVEVDFLSSLPEQGNIFSIDDDFSVDSSIAHLLGYTAVTIVKGEYPIDRTKNPNGTVTMNMQAHGLIIWVEIGRKSQGCSGFGFCRGGVGRPDIMDHAVQAGAQIENGRVVLNFLSELSGKSDGMPVDESVVLDSTTSRLLGYNSVSIAPGNYKVDYSKNPNGTVTMNMQAHGLIIWVEIGRKSQGCSGFGFCRGGVGRPDIMDHAVQASTQIENGQIHVNFLSPLPVKGDLMPVDENIVFDHASSQALGYKSVVVAHGEYQVDYTKNPNGEVTMAMQARGPIIWVEIGRKSAGCERFGLCRGGMESAAIERGVRAEVEMNGEKLSVDFISALPEKEEVLPVDEDIVFDAETSALIGTKQVVIRHGAYTVDYSGEGYGHVTLEVNAGTTAVETDVQLTGTSFGVFPNPSYGQTMMTLMLAYDGPVSLNVVNQLGQSVGTVYQGYFTQGRHTVHYDSSNLPAGFYYVHLSSGQTMQSLPLVIVH